MSSARALIHAIVLGSNEPQDFELLNEGQPINLAGKSVGFSIRALDAGGTLPDPLPSVAILSEEAGTVRVTGCEDLARGRYAVRYTVDGAAVPNGEDPDEWRVVR